VLSDWAAILEAGVQHTDFRFRRAAMVRVGYGWGHQHNDVLDLILWCHGVIHAAVGGERPEDRALGDIHSPKNQCSYTHNMVEVDGTGSHSSGQHRGHSWTRCLKDTDGARYVMAESFPSINHPTLTLYRRQVALVDVDEGAPPAKEPSEPQEFHPRFKLPPVQKTPDAYVFDVFRVGGGKRHTYCFHGCEEDEFGTNALNVRRVGFPEGENADTSDEAQYLKKFLVADSKTAGVAPEILQATWRLQRQGAEIEVSVVEKDAAGVPKPVVKKKMPRRNSEASILGPNYSPDAPRKYTRLHLLDSQALRVLTGKWVATSPNVTLQCLFAQKDGEEGLQTVFPAIIEMYEGQPCILAARSVPVAENENDALRATAVEIRTTHGHRDLCFADGRPEKARALENGMRAAGEFAFVSYDDKGLRQATLVGGRLLQAPGIAIDATPERRGHVVRMDYLDKKAIIGSMGLTNPALLRGASIEVGTPEHMTSYMLHGAEVGRFDAVILTFRKGMDYYSSRVLNVDAAKGEVRCGLGLPTDDGTVYPGMGKGLTASNEALTKSWRAEYLGGTREDGYVFRLTGGPVAAADFGEKGALRLWEFGVGDEVRIPTHVSLKRSDDGSYTLQADVACSITLDGTALETTNDRIRYAPRDGKLTATFSEAALNDGTVRFRIK
jgi:hypothetical protein